MNIYHQNRMILGTFRRVNRSKKEESLGQENLHTNLCCLSSISKVLIWSKVIFKPISWHRSLSIPLENIKKPHLDTLDQRILWILCLLSFSNKIRSIPRSPTNRRYGITKTSRVKGEMAALIKKDAGTQDTYQLKTWSNLYNKLYQRKTYWNWSHHNI